MPVERKYPGGANFYASLITQFAELAECHSYQQEPIEEENASAQEG
jgi:hypothetical protein